MAHGDDELMFSNGVIRTVDRTDSVREALLVRGGKIVAVGTLAEVRAAASEGAQRIDLGGKTVVPGFIDAHNHMSNAAFEPISVDCSTPPLVTIDEVLAAIEAHCRELPEGQWVRGFGFNSWQTREHRNPTKGELDEVAPRNPFFLQESNVHTGYANSLALAAVGIDECTPDPWGGGIERDERGALTGTLFEAATNLLQTASWGAYAEQDWDRAVDLLERKAREYLALGITGVGDACVLADTARLYRKADEAGRLPLTVQQLHGGDHFFSAQDLRHTDFVERVRGGDSHLLRGGTMKVFVDRAYPDGPGMHLHHDGCTTHAGVNFYSPREVHDLAVQAAALNIDLAIHGMGNCAVDSVSDAYEAVRRTSGDDRVLRLEHAFLANPEQAPRLASLGIDLVSNPGLTHHDGEAFAGWRRGDTGIKVMPLRSMIDAGVRVSFASDHPCGTTSPAEIMWSAVTREFYLGGTIDPEEAVTAREALRAYTINPAEASGRGGEEGSLEVGKRANLLVLDRDPLEVPAEAIRGLVVEQTYVDGKLVHAAGA